MRLDKVKKFYNNHKKEIKVVIAITSCVAVAGAAVYVSGTVTGLLLETVRLTGDYAVATEVIAASEIGKIVKGVALGVLALFK